MAKLSRGAKQLFSIWTSGSGGGVVYNNSYLELWWPSFPAEGNNLGKYGRGL